MKHTRPHTPRSTILLIDDSPEIIGIVNGLLKSKYHLKAANTGEKGLQLAMGSHKPDLILLDIGLPDMNGNEICGRLKANRATCDIPIIFLTGMSHEADEETGFATGAADYITKPIRGTILLARLKLHLSLKIAADIIKEKNTRLSGKVLEQETELEFIQDVTILAMASLAETRDNETGNHLRRTQDYIRILAEHLQHHPRFSLLLTRNNIDLIYKSAPLHDIGKVGIPDSILLKPGKLSADEFTVMKTHALIGRQAIEKAEKQLGRSAPFLNFAKEIAGSHQEKWDGSGYPEMLAGERIPISARLMALADVYDALVSARPYKKPMQHELAARIIAEGRGSHFDPDIVDAFLALQDRFRDINKRFKDNFQADDAT